MKQATLVLLLDNDRVLLAMKKRGFGKGRWNGVGGKPNDNESIVEAAIRETREEIGVEVEALNQVGTLNFKFLNNPDWDQEVLVYTSHSWKNNPTESEEMAPKWFNFKEIPYDEMWPDDIYWLPKVLEGKKVKAEFVFGQGDKVEKMNVQEM